MDLHNKNKLYYTVGVGAIIVALIAYKLRFLSLPYYWDEAWPYSVATRTLYDHGLSFMPTAIPAFVSRGHPLMFFFLGATWMKVFGTGLLQGHLFSLTVSVLLIGTIYGFCSRFFSARIGFIAALLFAVQAVFIAQSVFLMPEVLMALWTMACFYTWFTGRYVLFVLFAAAMLLTKESGGVLIIAFGSCEIAWALFGKPFLFRKLLTRLAIIAAPVALAGIYFVLQKILYGWFLYPFYMDYLSSQWTTFTKNLPSASAYLSIYYGRNGFSFLVIAAAITILATKRKYFEGEEKKVLTALCCYVAMYLVFSSVNYYIPRYLLCAFPPFIIAGAVVVDKAFARIRIAYPLAIAGIASTCLYFYCNHTGTEGDRDYSPSIKANMQVVSFCEQQRLNDHFIFTTCVLRYSFNEPCVGFLSGTAFTHIQWEFDSKTEYCVFSKDEYDEGLINGLKSHNDLQLIKRFDQGEAWCELYRVVKSTPR